MYYKGEYSGSKQTRYYVGVHDTAAGTVVLHDAGLFHMHPTVKASELVSNDQRDLMSSAGQIAARATLTDAFGGKRKRQAASAKLRYNMEESALNSMKSVAQTTLKDTASKAVQLNDADKEGGRPIPQFDLTTTERSNVYPFAQLIPPSVMAMLKPPAILICKAGTDKLQAWREAKVYPAYVLDTLTQLVHQKLKAKLHQVQILLYLSLIVKFRAVLSRPASMATIKKQLGADLAAPEQVVAGLVERFATVLENETGEQDEEKLKYRMSGFQKDLTVSFVFVLGMASDDYRALPVKSLASDMALTDKKARDYLRSLGCKVKSGTAKSPMTAELQAPLKFPLRLGQMPR